MIWEDIAMRVGRDTHHHALRSQAKHKQARRAVLRSTVSRAKIQANIAILYQSFPEYPANRIKH